MKHGEPNSGKPIEELAPWMQVANSYGGLPELVGQKLNPVIAAMIAQHTYFPVAMINPRTNWCAAFASACLERAKLPSPHSARALDFLGFGVGLKYPVFGALLVFGRGAPSLGLGHVGFCALTPAVADSRAVLCLGGNQGNQVCAVAKQTSQLKPGGIRWPASWPLPPGAELADKGRPVS